MANYLLVGVGQSVILITGNERSIIHSALPGHGSGILAGCFGSKDPGTSSGGCQAIIVAANGPDDISSALKEAADTGVSVLTK